MSFRLTQAVVMSPMPGITPSCRRLLSLLASYANDDGSGAYPSIRGVCKRYGIAYTTARRNLGKLLEAGYLIRVGRKALGDQTVIEYRIDISKLTLVAEGGGTTGGTRGGTTGGTRGGTTGGTQTSQSKPVNINHLPKEEDEEGMGGVAREACAAQGFYADVHRALYALPTKSLITPVLTPAEQGELNSLVDEHGADLVLDAIKAVGEHSHRWHRVKPEYLKRHLPEVKSQAKQDEIEHKLRLWKRARSESNNG